MYRLTYLVIGNKPICIGGQNITKACKTRRNYLVDTGIPLHRICRHLQVMSATIFASDTPLHILEEAAGRHQRQQHGISKSRIADLVDLLRRIPRQNAGGLGIHPSPYDLFAAILASGVRLMDFGTAEEQKTRSPQQQKEMLDKRVCSKYLVNVMWLVSRIPFFIPAHLCPPFIGVTLLGVLLDWFMSSVPRRTTTPFRRWFGQSTTVSRLPMSQSKQQRSVTTVVAWPSPMYRTWCSGCVTGR